MSDVSHELASEIGGRGKDPARDHVSFDLGEPEFDLIEPRRVGRCEVKRHPGVLFEKLLDPLRLVSLEVVSDDMDLLVFGDAPHNQA